MEKVNQKLKNSFNLKEKKASFKKESLEKFEQLDKEFPLGSEDAKFKIDLSKRVWL